MKPLSISWSDWKHKQQAKRSKKPLQAVVIGSGYGGSVAALRLAEMGYQVTVLERGSEFQPGDFPNDISQLPKFIRAPSADGKQVTGRANGLFEWRVGPGVVSLVGNGLGGGSLINAGVVMRPDDDVFAQEPWPASIRLPANSTSQPASGLPGLEEWLECAEGMLNSTAWRTTHTKTAAFGRVAGALRFPTEKSLIASASDVAVTIDSAECTNCGNCVTGCNTPGAKLTLRDTYLAQARKKGATLVRGASVWTIAPMRSPSEPDAGHAPVTTWRLRVVDTTSIARWPSWEDAAREEGIDIDAALLVLAAGTFGSTELLQRSRDRCGEQWWISPELGNRFSGNGDSLDFFVGDKEPVDAIGVGANSWQQPRKGDKAIGPTITKQINLRNATGARPIPLRSRLTIEDAAVPGAIAGVFGEMLATGLTAARLDNWRTGTARFRGKRASGAQDPVRGSLDPLAAGDELSRRSNVVLTMGHDESKGRIVWVPGRDASVPYWEHPEALETYRVQKQVFKDTAASLEADWIPNPAWRLLPESASQTMSGPALSTSITTVHPLGGCIMGDNPVKSVVDDVGRLWRSDRRGGTDSRTEWLRHENFLVLDGSIMPTALGVNPLLTITALAERAMAALNERNKHGATFVRKLAAQRKPGPPDEPPVWLRTSPQQWRVTMRERLVCDKLRLRGDLRSALGTSIAGGELQLVLEVDDWLKMWELATHPIDRVSGTLRLQVGADEIAQVATYRVIETLRCELLAVSEYGPGCWQGIAWVWKIGPWLRTMLTYLILRPDIWDSAISPKAGHSETLLEILTRRVLPGVRQFGHSAERRRMHYHLRMELDRGDEESPHLEHKWTQRWHDNLPNPSKLPHTIELIGKKRVEYPASWGELWRWLKSRLLCLRDDSGPVLTLRESFFDQASHLSVVVPDEGGSGARLEGRFLMDFSALLRNPPLKLGPAGDLTGGIAALFAYPGVFMRFLLKTRLPDFRLPNYSEIPLPDMATAAQLALKPPAKNAPTVRRYVLKVPRGASLSDGPDVSSRAKVELVLWRYARPITENSLPSLTQGHWYGKPVQRLKSVLLVHAYAQSGYSYTVNTLPENLAGVLYREGYEVWILEHRLSTRLPIHEEPSTLDQIARYDLPKAVGHVLATLKKEFKAQRAESLERPQLHVFAQCLGSAALAMSLLSGRLHYRELTKDSADLPSPRCPKLASIIFSQTHPLCIGQPGTQARTWVPAFIRDTLGWATVPLGVRGPVDSLAEAWTDRIFAALPIPEGEQCPHTQGASEDDCATCRRVRFIEAPLFKHRNLSIATHRELPLHFGKANIRTFAQSAKCVEAEQLVDEDGNSVYISDENVRKFAALPVAFLHGEENEVFHPESARRSAKFFARLHPDWTQLAAVALGKLPQDDSPERTAWLVPGHGHYDVLIGEQAPVLVYPGIARFFNSIQGMADQGDLSRDKTPLHAVLHYPRVGPMMGPLRSRKNRIYLRVSFMIDDRFPDGKQGSAGQPGTRCWAYARVRSGSHTSTHPLHVVRRVASARCWGSRSPYRKGKDDATAFRFAVGKIKLDITDWQAGDDLHIEAFSVHECLAPVPGAHTLPLHADLEPNATAPRKHSQAILSGGSFDQWLLQLLDNSLIHMDELAGYRLPMRGTASRVRLQAEQGDLLRAHVSSAARAALPDASANAAGSIRFLAGTCRYPGFPFDRERAEHAVQRVFPLLAEDDPAQHPAFGLFVGDQIYADATAGIVDSLSPTERFVERHRLAFSRSADYHEAAFGDLLANLPVVMAPDDHEYIDNLPEGPPLVPARTRQRVDEVQEVARCAANDAWRFFQSSFGGVGRRGWDNFDAGPLRVLVLDSRSHRQKSPIQRIFSAAQRTRILSWLHSPEAQKRLNLIATGSVVLPGLTPDADPANPGAPDTFQWAPADREWLLTQLAEAYSANRATFRFALLSGDYHVSQVSRLALDGHTAGLSIVVPPVYAPIPYANAPARAVDFSEKIKVPMQNGASATWSIEPLDSGVPTPVWTGSAIADIRVSRTTADPVSPYEIQFQADLVDYEQGGPACQKAIRTRI